MLFFVVVINLAFFSIKNPLKKYPVNVRTSYVVAYILDRCRASSERSERDLSDRMAFWPAQLNAALRCMANSITVLWLS